MTIDWKRWCKWFWRRSRGMQSNLSSVSTRLENVTTAGVGMMKMIVFLSDQVDALTLERDQLLAEREQQRREAGAPPTASS